MRILQSLVVFGLPDNGQLEMLRKCLGKSEEVKEDLKREEEIYWK